MNIAPLLSFGRILPRYGRDTDTSAEGRGSRKEFDGASLHHRLADGLGLMAARSLIDQGHEVTLHARNNARARDVTAALPAALSIIKETRSVAEQANSTGRFDAVIHNAGVGNREPRRIETVDGCEHIFAINVLAPYLLTALITPWVQGVSATFDETSVASNPTNRSFIDRSFERRTTSSRATSAI
jgi:NAD(P)-dependent dehydrogenase (short-subunit alcohol dehydrogenase family)